MTTDLAVSSTTDVAIAPLNALQLQQRLAVIQDVMRHVMRDGQDFGVIPGTDKPTLFKPGAEKLCVTFRLAAGAPVVESVPDYTGDIRYRVQVPILNADGSILAVGIGECSTGEEKYRWRRPVHRNEFDAAQADMRREKFQRNGDVWQQVRVNPSDVANTVLKMAHKRAYIHAVIMATAAGAIFTQDIEDLPEGYETQGTDEPRPEARPRTQAPQRRPAPSTQSASTPAKPTGARVISEGQAKRFFAIAMQAGWDKDALREWLKDSYGVDHSREIPADRYEEIIAALQESIRGDREPGAEG